MGFIHVMTIFAVWIVLVFAEVSAFYGVFPVIEKSWRMRTPERIAIALPVSALLVALVYLGGSWVDSWWRLPRGSQATASAGSFSQSIIWSSLMTVALFALSGLCYLVLGLRHQTLNRVITVTTVITVIAGWPLGFLALLLIGLGSVTNW